jgi:hypothetical protein
MRNRTCAGIFLFGLLGSTISVFATQPPTTATPANKRLLAGPDLHWTGTMLLPKEIDPNAYGALALRTKADGSKTFFCVGKTTMGTEVFEFTNAGFGADLQSAPRAQLVKKWDAYQGHRVSSIESKKLATQGLCWMGDKLFWVFGGNYDVGAGNKPVLGFTRFNADGTATAFGPWVIDVGQARARNYLTILPDWFAMRYTAGRRLAVGAGIESGSANASWGPCLYAIDMPSENTPAGMTLQSTPLVYYPAAQRLTRAGDYDVLDGKGNRIFERRPLFWPPVGTVGFWTGADVLRAAEWIEGKSVRGMLFANRFAYEHVWYGKDLPGIKDPCHEAKGQRGSKYRAAWMIYDPNDLATVATGSAASWQIRPKEVFDPTRLCPSMQLNCDRVCTGLVFDASEGMLYAMCPQVEKTPAGPYPVLHQFKVP